mgnify:FL=1
MSNLGNQVTDDKKKIEDACFASYNKGKEFFRSLGFHTASLFGMGEVLSRTPLGTSEIDKRMQEMVKQMKNNRWTITEKLFEVEQGTEEKMIQVLTAVLTLLNGKISYYEKKYKPQFEQVMLVDKFQIILFLVIIFVIIAFIDWKT